jgi:iron complex outermembrane receptor protein
MTQHSKIQLFAGAAGAIILSIWTPASAQTAADNGAPGLPGEVQEITVIGRAERVSPSNVPLIVTQPTSIVPPGFLKNNIIPLASYDDVVKFQPSVWSQNPNGPGIGKAETLSLRGFQDGQYNVTFDGIPFGDATDLHHTSSALFISHFLGEAEIDRGPGTASTIGKATFGGTIGFLSKTLDDQSGVAPYGTVGSFGTRAYGLELDSGKTGYGTGFVDYQHETTDGYLTYSNERRSNLMAKYEFKFNDDTSLTLLGTYNHEHQYTTQGATLAEYAALGPNYGLCNNPALQCFYGYNGSSYYSDFEYAKLKTTLFGIRIEDTLYTNGFGHSYSGSKDASDNLVADNGVTFYSPTTLKVVGTFKTDVPGKTTNTAFRSAGNILRAFIETPVGEVRTGVWYDEQHDGRNSISTDATQGGIAVPGKNGSAYSYDYKNVGTTWQPYVELEWKPIAGLLIIPGVKYTSFDRDVNALVNKNTKLPLTYEETFDAVQPSIAANYSLMRDWTVYAQIARGFLAPPVDVFQVSQIASLKPQDTLNYQVGTAYRNQTLMLGADLYYIDFSNYLAQAQVPGTSNTTYVNGGGALYQGVEFEAQYALGLGYSLYGNYSYNSAEYKHTDVHLAKAPQWTSALGLLYDDRHGPFFSIIAKGVGPHWGQDNSIGASGSPVFADQYRLRSVLTTDLAAGWRLRDVTSYLPALSVSLKVSNLFQSRSVSDFSGTQSVGGAPLYWKLAGRSLFLNVETKFH